MTLCPLTFANNIHTNKKQLTLCEEMTVTPTDEKEVHFTKYHGTGNDFIMIDDQSYSFDTMNTKLVALMCHRRFGIGADGLILVQQPLSNDEATEQQDNKEKQVVENLNNFHMVYYNSDGNQSSMCGNGGRCCVHFAKSLGLFRKPLQSDNNNEREEDGSGEERARWYQFTAVDGVHEASVQVNGYQANIDLVSLKMNDVTSVEQLEQDVMYLNTGSPHHCIFLPSDDNTNKNSKDIKEAAIYKVDVKQIGSGIRYSEQYAHQNGTNVNFIQVQSDDSIFVRTYERGVEDETYSCGTGAIASAIAHVLKLKTTKQHESEVNSNKSKFAIEIHTLGGTLTVEFDYDSVSQAFTNVYLKGPAVEVFKGVFKYTLNNNIDK